MPPAFHPQLGEIRTNAFFRRAMKDFPPVVWLTEQIGVPPSVVSSALTFASNETGEEVGRLDLGADIANAIALNRISLGFHPADIGAVRWREYRGYATAEGQELNETAREAGDDPEKWWISEQPVDILKVAEVRTSGSIMKPKMERNDAYLPEVKRMVELCRTNKGVFIPPTWLTPVQAARLAERIGKPIRPR